MQTTQELLTQIEKLAEAAMNGTQKERDALADMIAEFRFRMGFK